MSNNKEKNPLEVEIYYDEYPKPKLIKVTNTDVPLKFINNNNNITRQPTTEPITTEPITTEPITTEPITIDINSPKYISNNNETQNEIKIETSNTPLYVGLFFTLFCIGMGIMCIMIALEKNEPDEKYMIKLEGQIIYVFYLGVLILFCVCFCLSSVACVKCCDICLIFS